LHHLINFVFIQFPVGETKLKQLSGGFPGFFRRSHGN
jgi:hypothetical protein